MILSSGDEQTINLVVQYIRMPDKYQALDGPCIRMKSDFREQIFLNELDTLKRRSRIRNYQIKVSAPTTGYI
jgi:hypothetical protein